MGLRDLIHDLTHHHWTADREQQEQLHICVSRHWLPWQLNTKKIGVSVRTPQPDQYITGFLNLNQLEELLKLHDAVDMRMFIIQHGNGTLVEYEEE